MPENGGFPPFLLPLLLVKMLQEPLTGGTKFSRGKLEKVYALPKFRSIQDASSSLGRMGGKYSPMYAQAARPASSL